MLKIQLTIKTMQCADIHIFNLSLTVYPIPPIFLLV